MTDAPGADEVAQLSRAQRAAAAGDQQGLHYLADRAAAGSPYAFLALGAVYAAASPFHDPVKAEEQYRLAYELEASPAAIYLLGSLLYFQKRDDEAIRLFAEGASRGDGLCMYWLAIAYLQQNGFDARKTEIRHLLERASDEGYILATRRLSLLLMSGRYGLTEIPRGIAKYLGMAPQIFRLHRNNANDPRLLLD